jgi:PIN domain nuclease of toxin-antitoxin system
MAPSLLQNQDFQPLAVQLRHGVHAGGYPQAHRDPFDRLLAAQAELKGLQLVSLEPPLATFPCRLLWCPQRNQPRRSR